MIRPRGSTRLWSQVTDEHLRRRDLLDLARQAAYPQPHHGTTLASTDRGGQGQLCLLYTSDAADEL